jgi:hypothetical protein
LILDAFGDATQYHRNPCLLFFFVIDDVPKLNVYQIWQLLAYISTNRPTGVLISDRGSLVLVYC